MNERMTSCQGAQRHKKVVRIVKRREVNVFRRRRYAKTPLDIHHLHIAPQFALFILLRYRHIDASGVSSPVVT